VFEFLFFNANTKFVNFQMLTFGLLFRVQLETELPCTTLRHFIANVVLI